MYRLFMERMAANGIREARISEEWNELEGWTLEVPSRPRRRHQSHSQYHLFGFPQAHR